jgi:hypothetical protein
VNITFHDRVTVRTSIYRFHITPIA